MPAASVSLERLIECFGQLVTPFGRDTAAADLARCLDAQEIMVFVRDQELDAHLPARGFAQVIPKASGVWELVEEAAKRGESAGQAVAPGSHEKMGCAALSSGEAVLVAFGVDELPRELGAILAVLARALVLESREISLQAQLATSRQTALEAANLLSQLDLARRELEMKVRERTRELEDAVNELRGFSYTISHDLRMSLRAIVSTSRIIEEDYSELLPDEGRMLLLRQAKAALYLGELIEDLLALTRVSRQKMNLSDVNFTVIARELWPDLARAHATRATLVCGENMLAKADSNLARLLLLNLLDNAAKFSPEGGTVTFDREGSLFYVRDEGIGLDMAYAGKVFQAFERLHHDYEFPGTGIGLANAKRIVERHGGKIWVDSPGVGKGTTFFFTLAQT